MTGAPETVNFQDELRAAIATAGGNAPFARAAGVEPRAVWDARDDREPHPRILRRLGLEQVTVTTRSKAHG